MHGLTSRDSLSRSDLWQAQRGFYQKEGVAAWNSQVPFYITSNPYLANAYAHVITRFIQDHNAADPSANDEPIYIFELGSGSGVFSFYLLKSLLELRNNWFGFGGKFVYIMSDLVDENLAFAENHPALNPFIEQGLLQFASFDAEKSESIQLNEGVLPLAGKPLIVIANYIFDTLLADVFHISINGIEELQIKRDIDIPKLEPGNAAFTVSDLDPDAHYKEISLPHFSEPALDQVLAHYLEQKQETVILFPTGPLSCLERLRKLSPRMMVLVADKGMIEPAHDDIPGFVTHSNCFSTMVNLHALGVYAKHSGGDAFHHPSNGMILSALFIGHNLSGLPETRRALAQSLAMFNPGHLYEVYGYFSETKPRARLDALLALLQLTAWDPVVFNQFFDVIMASLPFVQMQSIEQLASNAHRIAANLFHIPGTPDTYALLGNFFQEIKRFEEALAYYQRSIDTFGPIDNVFYNMGLCHYYLQNNKQALAYMQQTLETNAGYILAKGWIAQIREEETFTKITTES